MLKSLTQRYLMINHLSGLIPISIGNLSQLDILFYNITCLIPQEMGMLKSLTQLNVENNSLSGSIPASKKFK